MVIPRLDTPWSCLNYQPSFFGHTYSPEALSWCPQLDESAWPAYPENSWLVGSFLTKPFACHITW